MTRILVTGGCGFIGSNFIRRLLRTDLRVHVVNLDALTYAGRLSNLEDIAENARYRFIRGDIRDRTLVRKIVSEGVDAILHFAAESHVDRSILDAAPFVTTNVVGTQILLDAAREFRIQRFLQVSTDEVYGSLGPTGFFTEEAPLAPNSPYSASKAAADLLVRAYNHTFGLHAVISRCSNNYGPYQLPEKCIPLFIGRMLRDETIPMYGDGLQVRDWINVEDHCAALDLLWRKGRAGEVYNIGGQGERTNLELTHALLKATGKPASLIRHVQDRPGHDRRYAIDSSKIKKELGWSPTVSLEDGLRQTVKWYQDHQEWATQAMSGENASYLKKQYGLIAG